MHDHDHGDLCCLPSRRALLGGLAAIGIGVALRRRAAADQNPRRVDTHHHFFPPDYLTPLGQWAKAQPGLGGVSPPQRDWTAARALDTMDQNDVATAVLSISTPGVYFGDEPQARRLARLCNDYAAQMMRDHAGRFGLFAAMPMPDVDGTLAEIAYALDVLKADGIGFMTSYGDTWPGDPKYVPVFEELDRRKAIAYFHPLVANCCGNLIPGVPAGVIEYPIDTARAIVSLLFNGTFARFRNIRFLFSHAGGAMPMLAGRIVAASSHRKDLATIAPNGIADEFARLHYDTANATAAPTMAALRALVPTSQIVFGTDYPYYSLAENIAGLDAIAMSLADRQAIERGNAVRLIPRLQG